MKTIDQVLKEHGEYASLIKAVVEQLGGTDYILDIVNSGMEAGFPGFTYTNDNVEFYRKNKKQILKLLVIIAESWSEPVLRFIKQFSFLKNSDYDNNDIINILFEKYNSKYDEIYQALTWFAAEIICSLFEESTD